MPTARRLIAIIFVVLERGQAHVRAGGFDSILYWRNIGPYRGGRTRAIAGDPSQANVFYMAPVNGRVFKSIDYGRMWQPIFDDQPTAVQLRSRLQIRTSFTSAAVKDCIGRIFQSATAFINRAMPARRGGS